MPLVSAEREPRAVRAAVFATPPCMFVYMTLHLVGLGCAAAKGAGLSAGWQDRSWALAFAPFWLADAMAVVVVVTGFGVWCWKPALGAKRVVVVRALRRTFALGSLASLFLGLLHVSVCRRLSAPSQTSPVWCLLPFLALVLEFGLIFGPFGSRPRPLATICFTILFAALLLLGYNLGQADSADSLLRSWTVIAFVLFVLLLFAILFHLTSKHCQQQIKLTDAQACSVALYTAALVMVLPALISCASMNGMPAGGPRHAELVATLWVFLVGLACAEVGVMIAITNYVSSSLLAQPKVSLVQTAAGVVPETRVTQNWLLVGDVAVINLEPQHALQPRGIKGRCLLCHPFCSWIRCCVEPDEDAADEESELRRTTVTKNTQAMARRRDESSKTSTAGTGADSEQRRERERTDSGTYTDLHDFDDL